MNDPDKRQLDKHLRAVEELVGHRFQDQSLLLQSLTHSSYSNELANLTESVQLKNNERLEFLGDAVIGLVVARELMNRYPEACEGRLSRWRSSLVSRKTLAQLANELDLGDHLLLGRGELRTGGAQKRSILAASIEAVVGALYLDAGIERASQFLAEIYTPLFESFADDCDGKLKMLDRKTHLQERIQSVYKTTPLYRLVRTWGPEHEKYFRVEILINDQPIAEGEGRSKKDAEQHAAGLALEELKL